MGLCRSVSLAVLLVAGCAPTTTLFQTDFNSSMPGSPPAAAQAVGTATWFGAGGSVVIAGPIGGSPDHWLQIGRGNNAAPVAGMTGTFASLAPPGVFHFTNVMYLPANAGAATIEFDGFNPSPGSGQRFECMHLDFLPDNHVRIDDLPSTEFGTFPRNAPFDVFVTLNTAAAPPTATIALVGGGASGSTTYTIRYPSPASQLDAVTLWMGYPWVGTFDATDVIVTRETP